MVNKARSDLSQRTTIPIADLVLETEAAFNLLYVNQDDYSGWEIDTAYFQVDVSNGNVTEEDAEEFYEAALQNIAEHFACVTGNPKDPQLYDLEYTLNGQSNSASIIVISIVGNVMPTWSKPKSFGPGEDWDPIYGNCDASIQGWDRSAATEISRVINFNRRSGVGFYFTEIEYHAVEYGNNYGWGNVNSNDPNPGDGIIDYLHFFFQCDGLAPPCSNYDIQNVLCIEYSEMNWYMNNVNNYISSVETNLSKKFYFAALRGGLIYVGDCGVRVWRHGFTFGKRHIRLTEIETLPTIECED